MINMVNPLQTYKERIKTAKSKKERRQLKQQLKSIQVPTSYELICDDIRNYQKHIAPDSIDFIITDPPYSKRYLHLYEVLSELGHYALKEDGLCLVMTGQSYLPEVINKLSKKLFYQWTMAYLTPGGQSPYIWKVKCNTFWKPVLVFTKTEEYKHISFGDVIKTSVNNNDKRYHHWGQSVEGFSMIMKKFVFPGQIILDPFVGGGTVAVVSLMHKCSFIGMDIDKECITKTWERIREFEGGLQQDSPRENKLAG